MAIILGSCDQEFLLPVWAMPTNVRKDPAANHQGALLRNQWNHQPFTHPLQSNHKQWFGRWGSLSSLYLHLYENICNMTKQQSKKDRQDSISRYKRSLLTGDLFLQPRTRMTHYWKPSDLSKPFPKFHRGGIRAFHCCSLKMPITLTWFWNIKYLGINGSPGC